jgi:hypothetical protein
MSVKVIVDGTFRRSGGVALYMQEPVSAAFDAASGAEPPPRNWTKLELRCGTNNISVEEITQLERIAADSGLILCKANDGLYFLTNGVDENRRNIMHKPKPTDQLAFDSARSIIERCAHSRITVS